MKAVIIYSGGMDSFTLLNELMSDVAISELFALSFNYNQKHSKELDMATQVCKDNMIDHQILKLPKLEGSALTGRGAVPEGHYTDSTMKQTVVPNRNMVMLSHAVAYAISVGADQVYYGAHSGDHAIYPDCRQEFISAFNSAAKLGNYEQVKVVAPYINLTKGDILELGLMMDLDYSDTWTCYNGRDLACGKCGACVERLEAFEQNGIKDPLVYENA